MKQVLNISYKRTRADVGVISLFQDIDSHTQLFTMQVKYHIKLTHHYNQTFIKTKKKTYLVHKAEFHSLIRCGFRCYCSIHHRRPQPALHPASESPSRASLRPSRASQPALHRTSDSPPRPSRASPRKCYSTISVESCEMYLKSYMGL